MDEASTYCGASRGHAICEKYVFQPNEPLKMFQRDEVCDDINWLDVKNCSGSLDHTSFRNLPNLEILNIDQSNFTDINKGTFSTIKSLDIWKSNFPLTENTFYNCPKVDSLRLIGLENKITHTELFKSLKNVDSLTLDHVSISEMNGDLFLGLENLKYLFITKCTIGEMTSDCFSQLDKLETFYFTGNTLETFCLQAFTKLINLKILGVHDNFTDSSENLAIDYQIFQGLPALETASFPEESLKKLDFDGFKSLKNIQLVIGKASEDIIDLLEGKNISVDWITDTDLTEDGDVNNSDFQICA